MTPLRAYLILLGLVAGQRLGELALSRRNERILRKRGAVEVGARHYPVMVVFHTLFLVACAVEAVRARRPPTRTAVIGSLLVLALAQVIRWWAMGTLRERWTTRILVLPGAEPVVTGPYRFLRHPNYLAVILELGALPLAYGNWRTALVFGLANAVLLTVRITVEERALGAMWANKFRDRGRFIPGPDA